MPQFRTGAVAKRERHAGEQRRRGRHHDGAEAQQARLADRRDRRHMVVALRRYGKVDQYDAVLLNDPDQQDNPDDADHRQVHLPESQRQQGADAGGRKRGKDG